MYLNAMRWVQGASKSGQSLESYRQYMVSHEMGHILGHEHAKCPAPGQPAPIMMQQTLGLHECVANTRITKSDLKV
jgi:ssRNA-specific RNase YbeY (16S rRNA maturation enzyme)